MKRNDTNRLLMQYIKTVFEALFQESVAIFAIYQLF